MFDELLQGPLFALSTIMSQRHYSAVREVLSTTTTNTGSPIYTWLFVIVSWFFALEDTTYLILA